MRKCKKKLTKILEDEILFGVDDRGRIVDANKTALEVFGYTRKDLGKIGVKDVVVGRYLPLVIETIEKVAKGRKMKRSTEVLCRTRDGRMMWVEVKLKPIRRRGRMLILGIARDVTMKKELEERLRDSEEMFRVMAERSLVGVYFIQDGVFRYINPKMAELWGYEVDEIIGRPPTDFVHPDDREIVERNIRLRIEGKVESANYKVRILRKDGEVRIVEVYGSRMTFRGKPAIIGTLVDITEKVKMQEEIERLNKLLRILNEIGQLIAREKDVDSLLDGAVEKLSRFYHLVAIC